MMDKTPKDNNLAKADISKDAEKSNTEIKSLIYNIRGQQVMLDSDLAKLYQVETKQLNRQVKRNIERFDSDFCFQLSKEEYQNLKCQIGTSNQESHGGRRKLPLVFTETGVSMLAGVLHSEIAITISKDIIRAFVAMRKHISSNLVSINYYSDMLLRHDSEIKLIQQALDQFTTKQKDEGIYFNGQIYDAYSRILKIFSGAKKSLTIIDAYTDIITLNIIKRLTIPVTIITSKSAPLKSQDIKKYQEQYSNLTIIYNNTFHDRYFILDGKTVYHCGASINRIGYKTFSITKINDEEITAALLSKIDTCIKNGWHS